MSDRIMKQVDQDPVVYESALKKEQFSYNKVLYGVLSVYTNRQEKMLGYIYTIPQGTHGRFPHKHFEIAFKVIQSTFRSLEMHSKECYKICICSVILGELKSFRNYKGFNFIFPENFKCNSKVRFF